MRKTTSFVCQECGYDTPSWLGKCPECGSWNSFREIKTEKLKVKSFGTAAKSDASPKRLGEIKFAEEQRLATGFSEVNMVLGGGIVKGSVILLAGDPGIGKSTLLLQIALSVSSGSLPHVAHDARLQNSKNKSKNSASLSKIRRQTEAQPNFNSFASGESSLGSVLYISGEESQEQIKMRSERLSKTLDGSNLFILSTTSADAALSAIEKIKPSLVIVDSIQTMESENVSGMSGSIPQIRYNTSLFIKFAKTFGVPVILVGHVTKEGMVAGPMVLSHMVDTVLFLEGEKFTSTRILRSLKNRFGPVDEVGILSIDNEGMKEIKNTDQLFLSKDDKKSKIGSVIVVTLEGSRVFLVEVQALAVASKMPFPRRVSSGVDGRRLELLLAILQKHADIPFSALDVFVNVAGGLKLSDPGADLGICLALVSSFKNIRLNSLVAVSEVGLLGELREPNLLDKRLREVKKLGFKRILSSKTYQTIGEAIKAL